MKALSKETFFIVIAFFMMQEFCIGQLPIGCKDSTLTIKTCTGEFEPVCGCDNKTYKNECYANNNQIHSTNGPCEPIAIDFNPNPGIETITLTAVVKYPQTVNMFITDINGKVYFSDSYPNSLGEVVTINVRAFPRGIYFIFCITDYGGAYKKMFKETLQ